ncbi:MAG: thymidine phosphorylase [Andreesenia angusta]|nr:thymidine phosphorylase [Andreesenia angusta]
MRIYDIIERKKNGKNLTKKQIKYFIEGVTNETIPDYQISALLMAISLKGMDDDEVYYLTKYILESGEKIDLFGIDDKIVDKHSTGGIGDKTTIIVGPIVAACGLKFAKLSGRGLGLTGGTIDKLESIKGFRTDLSLDEFIESVKKYGLCISGQTGNIVPADKKLYAIRDVTATVDSIPLIAASIMSKKLALNSDSIFIDVKVGIGAFMKTIDDARKLANTLVKLGERFDREVVCYLTNMDEPLGLAIGNSVEIYEAIDVLKNKGHYSIVEFCIELSAELLLLGEIVNSIEEGRKIVKEKIENGEAYEKFVEMVENQNGSIDDIPRSDFVLELNSEEEGYIYKVNAKTVGEAAMILGSGRENKDDQIDHTVGIILNKKVGSRVKKGEKLAYIHTNSFEKGELAKNILMEAFSISVEHSDIADSIIEKIK